MVWNDGQIEKEVIKVEEIEFPKIPDECFTASLIPKDRILTCDKHLTWHEILTLSAEDFKDEDDFDSNDFHFDF